jgi:signal transduction protein with GAF and PtsI domain
MSAPDGRDGVADQLQQLCRTLTTDLAVMGVAVNLMSAAGSDGVMAASGDRSRDVDELQFSTGEGPCHDAYASRRPVLTPDLRSVTHGRWPAYTSAAREAGLAAVFAFPLHLGAVVLGVLDVYADRPGSLSEKQVAAALTCAQLATEILLDGDLVTADGRPNRDLSTALDHRAEIYQAQGMVMVDLGVDPAVALARMRAHAFGNERPLIDLARDIVAGFVLPVDA